MDPHPNRLVRFLIAAGFTLALPSAGLAATPFSIDTPDSTYALYPSARAGSGRGRC